MNFNTIDTTELIALTAYGEASGDGKAGMQAVINVIHNRTRESKFKVAGQKDVYKAVILKPKQFSVFNTGNPVRATLVKFATDFSYYVATNSSLNTAYKLARLEKLGLLLDKTKHAVFYHRKDMVPSWSKDYLPTVQIGDHVFYRESKSIIGPVIETSVLMFIVGFVVYKYRGLR